MGTGSSGAVAERISNASFATLMLIYSFTELLDLADVLSDFAGLTARIAQLLEVSCPLLSIHKQLRRVVAVLMTSLRRSCRFWKSITMLTASMLSPCNLPLLLIRSCLDMSRNWRHEVQWGDGHCLSCKHAMCEH